MGEKTVEIQTSLSVKECGERFQSGIVDGRGLSARLGDITAKLMGGESLTWYTPEDDSPFAALNDDRPHFSVGVAVPKAQGAHMHGTNVHMYVWDRGDHRDVLLLAHHSLAGGAHANQLLEAIGSRLRSVPAQAQAPQSTVAAAQASTSTVPADVSMRQLIGRRDNGSACVSGSCEARGRPIESRRCPECGQLTQPL